MQAATRVVPGTLHGIDRRAVLLYKTPVLCCRFAFAEGVQ